MSCLPGLPGRGNRLVYEGWEGTVIKQDIFLTMHISFYMQKIAEINSFKQKKDM